MSIDMTISNKSQIRKFYTIFYTKLRVRLRFTCPQRVPLLARENYASLIGFQRWPLQHDSNRWRIFFKFTLSASWITPYFKIKFKNLLFLNFYLIACGKVRNFAHFGHFERSRVFSFLNRINISVHISPKMPNIAELFGKKTFGNIWRPGPSVLYLK